MTKIMFTSDGPDLDSLVSEEFGHCAFLLMYDTATDYWEAWPNEAPEAGVGAGMWTADQIIKRGPDMVLTGYVGPHGEKKLRDAGIKVIMDEEGTIIRVIERFKKRNPGK